MNRARRPSATDLKPSDMRFQKDAPLRDEPSPKTSRAAPAPRAVFIHSAPRTSSTWFWSRFRALPSTLCYYEPLNDKLAWLTAERAATLSPDSWNSRHPATDPYYREYGPLLKAGGGVEKFDTAMAYQWFVPEGGLRGRLRAAETDYFARLIEHAEAAGKVAVFGGWRSLGRVFALKQAFGGYHVFQYRNLWRQWLSILSYKRRGSLTFYVNLVDTLFRDDEPYFAYLRDFGLRLAADPRTGRDPLASPLTWTRSYPLPARDEAKAREIEQLPEPRAFALYTGLQIYLYLQARMSADASADVTRLAREPDYRRDVERQIVEGSGLPVSFADASDSETLTGVDFSVGAVDWDEVREHARVAARMLSAYGDLSQLTGEAEAFVDETMAEARATAGPTPKTIGLCMIVKNEIKVIRRCLQSTLPLVDYILVVDTGSTDGTQQMIRDFLAEHHINGAVIEEPWRDFAYNRSFAMARLREVAEVDYALVIDADDTLEIDAGFDTRAFKTHMQADLYDVAVRHGAIAHHRPQLFANTLPFSFKGVLHEYLEAPPGALKRENANGFAIRATTRRRAQSESPQIPGRRGGVGASAGDRDRPVPDLALHLLSRAELSRLRREGKGAGQLPQARRPRLLGGGDLCEPA